MSFPDICVQPDDFHPSAWPVLSTPARTAAVLTVVLRDRAGDIISLAPGDTVELWAKDYFSSRSFFLAAVPGIQTDGGNGLVSFALSSEQLGRSGLFLGEVVVRSALPDSSSSSSSAVVCLVSGAVKYRYRCYLEVTPTLENVDMRNPGCLSIAEVRMAIRDKDPSDNFLLDAVEFTDTEIIYAIRRPVDLWNEALPPLDVIHTTETFPYRANWMNGTVGELLRMGAINQERNHLRYAAASISVDDKDKAAWYMQTSALLLKEYTTWVQTYKRALNMQACWGSTSLRSMGNYRL